MNPIICMRRISKILINLIYNNVNDDWHFTYIGQCPWWNLHTVWWYRKHSDHANFKKFTKIMTSIYHKCDTIPCVGDFNTEKKNVERHTCEILKFAFTMNDLCYGKALTTSYSLNAPIFPLNLHKRSVQPEKKNIPNGLSGLIKTFCIMWRGFLLA